MIFSLLLTLFLHPKASAMTNERMRACRRILSGVQLLGELGGYTFNRANLPEGTTKEDVLNVLIELHKTPQPILIMDTNPGPEKFFDHNIVGTKMAATFSERSYEKLHAGEREQIFDDFARRIGKLSARSPSPVIIIDHHFGAPFLSDASTTPMMIDFMDWVQRHPDEVAVRRVLHAGLVIRDHSDPDILLANYVLQLIDRPEELRLWGPLMRRIALFNDHGYLDPKLTEHEINETRIGLAMAEAFEIMISEQGLGFGGVLPDFEEALRWVVAGTWRLEPGTIEPVAEFLSQPAKAGLGRLNSVMLDRLRFRRRQEEKVRQVLLDKRDVKLRGPLLAMRFRDFAPSALGVAQVLQNDPALMPAGVRLLAVIVDRGEGRVQVKLRALDPLLSLDSVFAQVRARALGGGGRFGAGSLYGNSGATKTDAEIARDLEWLETQIE